MTVRELIATLLTMNGDEIVKMSTTDRNLDCGEDYTHEVDADEVLDNGDGTITIC